MRCLPFALIAFLFAGGAVAADRLPAKEGQCTITTIKSVGTRLDGVPDSGDSVTYADGGYQVSYAAIPGLKGSRPGDPAKLCLISVPDDCPPGDDRGKVYRATNLRTHKSWEAPNAEHDCGGA